MARVRVNLGDRSYNIEIDKGLLFKTDYKRFKASRYVIITDSFVKRLFGKDLVGVLKKQGLKAEMISFPSGEESKTLKVASDIGRELARRNYDRNSLIIALGGGVVGDLAGFIASFYERGIRYIQVPTTLIGMVDSAIGGKTGVNIPEGKNLFGTIYQPEEVIVDTEILRNLPEGQIKNGMAEIIKYAVIGDKGLFSELEKGNKVSSRIVEKACRVKAKIVEKDEREKELRKILNYGHTIGHAVELAENFKIPHGEAVAIGMVYETKIANRLGLLSKKDMERQNKLIKKAGLPISYKGNADELVKNMRRDKKNIGGKVYFILPVKIGDVKKDKGKVAFPVDESVIKESLG
ncbi:3-dehydroquinate synthase [Candidatus Woesearchaeota archaeon]|nr:3-dehydroquinate synthase [Candidatus Woesearchaeota archaeon]